MRDVTVSRFVRAPPAVVERALTPTALVTYEEAFAVRDVTESPRETRVVADARGLEVALVFEEGENGLRYRLEGNGGPYERMETTVTWRRENEGVRVTVRSSVAVSLFPRPLTNRVAAWKREAELDTLLDRLAETVE